MMSNKRIDLLTPANADSYKQNYMHQMRQTIDAYLKSMIVLGEGLQNAIDAVCDHDLDASGKISVVVDFDNEEINIADNGKGFPKDASLLYLGGTGKLGKKLKGKVGVGIKVSMFSSSYFCIKSKTVNESWKLEIEDAYNFENLQTICIPDPLPTDPSPLEEHGTLITYRFPQLPQQEGNQTLLDVFVHEIIGTTGDPFLRTVKALHPSLSFPSPFAALLSSFLRRFSYLGDALQSIGKQEIYPKQGIEIKFTIRCLDPVGRFGDDIGSLFGMEQRQSFMVEPSYLQVSDTLQWVPKGKKRPMTFQEKLGPGGKSLEITSGFNCLRFTSEDGYESLLLNARGSLPGNIDFYKRKLFPKINGITLAIGRIPDFENYLPGGSRRVISCNGIVTSHDIDLTRGRNQQYVRCFDLVIDLDGDLNYGKTQLTNSHLVKWTRDYINLVYVNVLQNATGKWVGRLPYHEDEPDRFFSRDELGLPDFAVRRIPQDENDVIALFFEALGKNKIKGYRIFGLSQKDRYDCRAAIQREGDNESILEPEREDQLKVVEFKLKARDIIRDFDQSNKFPREVHLVIAWEEGSYESKYYEIYDIHQSEAYEASPKKVFPEVTHYIHDAKQGTEVQVLLLQEFATKIQSESQE